jgi:hypothetical protein
MGKQDGKSAEKRGETSGSEMTQQKQMVSGWME